MIFLNSASSAAAPVFDLPLCTHTDTEGKPEKARVQNIFLNLRKNTIFNEHTVSLREGFGKNTIFRDHY